MDEFDLPEPIIQLIQSFLTSKQAARTTLLSESWRGAWLTRPNLDIDEPDFCRSNSDYNELYPKFLAFGEKTLERYENSNLKIHNFSLSMQSPRYRPCGYIPAANLVCRALKLGPTCLAFEFLDYYCPFTMPIEVFEYENLVSLTAKGCSINPNRDDVCCSRLGFLSFNNVWIRYTDTIFCITSSCPLIEKLSLCNVKVIDRRIGECVIVSPLHRLNSLVLKHVAFDTLFLAHLSSNFPSLKDLTLRIGEDREEILISSPTLERLDFSTGNRLMCDCYTVRRVKLHIPSIRKLTFACISIPDEVSITSNSRGWESRLSVTRAKCLSASWFYRLSNFIDKFKFSRISLLSLQLYDRSVLDHELAGDIRGLPKPEIENVTIHDTQLMRTKGCYALFHGLFQMCHPKLINVRSVRHGTHIINFLAKRLLTIPNDEFMSGLNDLKEARAQVFDAAVSTWRDVSLESLVDEEDSTTPEEDHQWDAESLAELTKGTTTTYETDDGSIVIEELDYDSRSIEESYCDSTTVDKFPVIRFQLNWKQ